MAGARGTSRKKLIIIVVLAAILGWVLYDLYAPRTAHLKSNSLGQRSR